MLLERTYKLPPKCSVKSVRLRQTNGFDERKAAKKAETKKTLFAEELLALSIIEVDGEPVPEGAAPVANWASGTRAAVMEFFNHLNEVPDEAIQRSIKEAEADEERENGEAITPLSAEKIATGRSLSG